MAIEFAAIAIPLMFLLAGSMEIGRYIWTQHALQDAASTGARCLGLRTAPCFADDTMDGVSTVAVVRAQAAEWIIQIPIEAVTPEVNALCESVMGFAKVRIRHRFISVVSVLPEAWINVEACFPLMHSE